eukprot:1159731-Pelagomonas_calceolata.AAC.5
MPPVCIRHRRPALIVISNGSSTSKIGSAQRGECKDPSNGIDVREQRKMGPALWDLFRNHRPGLGHTRSWEEPYALKRVKYTC